jgi:processive 1,2-diacylglycerol beta-glucosyltransferase
MNTTKQVDLVVAYSPVGGGHKAAAIAVALEARARGMEVETLDAFAYAPRWFGDAYVGAHLAGQHAMPNFYGSAYFAANRRDGALEPIRRGFDHLLFAPLVERVIALAPATVVGTHHLPLLALGRARRIRRLASPLIGVVTDYTAHAVWAERGVDAFSVPCELAKRELASNGVRPDSVFLTGIPVKRAFDEMAPVRDPAPGEPLRVLVTSGGFGVGPARRIVRSFAGVPAVELTVVCGNAPALVRRLERELAGGSPRVAVVGFERDMPARVAAAHVVVGKAGGLTVSETMTAGRPMVIVGAVPGNEKLNEEHVVRAGAGCASEPDDVARVVLGLRDQREIARMGARARALVMSRSAARVVDLALGTVRWRAAA